jgi:hypothetical protein
MRNTIVRIETFIKERAQYVEFYTKERTGGAPIFFTFESLYNHLYEKYTYQIDIKELEILLGSYLETIYFKKGEIKRNGSVAKYDGTSVKAYHLILNGTVDEVKKANASNLFHFQTLYDIHIFKNKWGEGVRLRTTTKTIYFMDLIEFERYVGISRGEFSLLRGVILSPIFYKAGEMKKNWPIWEDNKVIKNLNLRVFKSIDYNFQINGNQVLQGLTSSRSSRYETQSDYDTYRPSYEKYGGYNGYDDDTIDNAFEGNPEATWNVD